MLPLKPLSSVALDAAGTMAGVVAECAFFPATAETQVIVSRCTKAITRTAEWGNIPDVVTVMMELLQRRKAQPSVQLMHCIETSAVIPDMWLRPGFPDMWLRVMLDSGKNEGPNSGKATEIQGKIGGAGSGNSSRRFRGKKRSFREFRGSGFREISGTPLQKQICRFW